MKDPGKHGREFCRFGTRSLKLILEFYVHMSLQRRTRTLTDALIFKSLSCCGLVVELVDALDSKSSVRKDVSVRL